MHEFLVLLFYRLILLYLNLDICFYSFWEPVALPRCTVVILWCGRFSRHGSFLRGSRSCWLQSCWLSVFCQFSEWIRCCETGLRDLRHPMSGKVRTDSSYILHILWFVISNRSLILNRLRRLSLSTVYRKCFFLSQTDDNKKNSSFFKLSNCNKNDFLFFYIYFSNFVVQLLQASAYSLRAYPLVYLQKINFATKCELSGFHFQIS